MTPSELKQRLFELNGKEYKDWTLSQWRRDEILIPDENGDYNDNHIQVFINDYIVLPTGTLLSKDATAYLADRLSVIGRPFHIATLSIKRDEIDPNSGSLITRESYFHITALDAYADKCIKLHNVKLKSRECFAREGYKLLMAIIDSGVSGNQVAIDTGIDRASVSLAVNEKMNVSAGMYRKLVAAYGDGYDR